ncbi:dimethyl sulfoxide reductase anchor subunit family protein [Caenimonas soli]|uniref:dimethyl sulfoxide reductase anchor subunit family protein n=1 Tax=Caenimonas soli TaxID=2735555 RepID=UPI0015571293|nr:DmsC/YnfH family molybdoenzyme membrane anchor subunit [Caenimonas soli]NPC59112.1 dimethyl sulfoxide reductase anchor subunit [Caenimonas soli]
MNPALSIIVFTTLAGAAQGLAVVLAVLQLAGMDLDSSFASRSLWVAVAILMGALVASFFHLGRPSRAWRAAMMWRTSWMSREVIVLPFFVVLVAAWAYALSSARFEPFGRFFPWIVIAAAAMLWYCTAMIYACIRFIQEWAHPLTIVNYTVIGLSSGSILAGALGVTSGQARFVANLTTWTIAITALAWLTRALSLRRNAKLKPKSTLQSATGIHAPRLVQKSMGMTGGAFNTREFFHHASVAAFRRMKIIFQVLGFAAPLALLAFASASDWNNAWLVALPIQFVGLLAERWFFFAQARHPQNLYYQVVS